jgi:diguanylate cyclase (GGDEF)-like protein
MPVSFSAMHLLVPCLLLLLGFGMVFLWRLLRARRELAWMGLGFSGFGLGLLVQVTKWPNGLFPFVMAFTLFHLTGVTAMARALSLRLGVAMAWKPAALLALVLLGVQAQFSAVTPSTELRVYIFSFGAMLLMGLPLISWQTMQMRNVFDHAVRWSYLICIGVFLLRTIVLAPGLRHIDVSAVAGDPAVNITQTWYWITIHYFALFTAPALAVAMALAVASDYVDGLKHERNRDPLTQLLNRRGFDERVQTHRQSNQSGRRALLLCDLDHFKEVNDRWGHAIGDQVLMMVAYLLTQCVRSGDIVARMGGEEFVVIFCDSDLKQAELIAERLRAKLAEQRIPALDGHQITFSMGLVELKSLEPDELARALHLADTHLYAAKQAGRNRVDVHRPTGQH